MKKSILAGVVVVAASGIATTAGLTIFEPVPQYAQVVSSRPIKEFLSTPRQQCREVTVTHSRTVPDARTSPGTDPRGNIATVSSVTGSQEVPDTDTRTVTRCQTVYEKSENMIGYDVTYRIGNQQGKVRMEQAPPQRIPLDKNGLLVLSSSR